MIGIEIFIDFMIFILFLIGLVYAFKKNRTVFKWLLVGGISFFIISGYYLYSRIPDFTKVMSINWKIDLPKPKKEELVASNGGGLPGDAFSILEYSNDSDINKLNQNLKWSYKDSPNDSILNKIQIFMEYLNEGLKSSTKAEKYIKLQEKIKANSSFINTDFKYFYKEKENQSFIILVFNPNEKKIYSMQSMR